MTIDPMDPKVASQQALILSKQGEYDRLKNLAAGGAKNIEEVATQFESIFLNFLIKQMWESVEKSDLLPESPGQQIHEGMITNMLSEHLAKNGGIGIAKSLVAQLKGRADVYEQQSPLSEKAEGGKMETDEIKDLTPSNREGEQTD